MSEPSPGKHIKFECSTSGNRHKKGAKRIAVKIEILLTGEPEEAESLAQCLGSGQELDSTDQLADHLALLRQLVTTTPKKKKDLIRGLVWGAYHAKLSKWVAGTGPMPKEPEIP